ncbi:MAG: hypothetical protein M1817_004694 [Caeruleum heppii]|nr:MAG: hypothetical protein M1817_004694 [Caeruleum heppii]
MASTSTAMITTSSRGAASYHLDTEQTLKASRALVKHIRSETKRKAVTSDKRDLLAPDGDSDGQAEGEGEDDMPIWLVLTTKRHIFDKKRLKPGKILLPHPIYTSSATTICLITPDPQRPFKDAIAHPSFPGELRPRITRVIGVGKLRTKYKSFESRRQLLAEHDLFLADDRVITLLPNVLGKIFYKQTTKRPIPVNLAAHRKDVAKLPPKMKGKDEAKSVGTPIAIANEITRTLSTALVYLSPSTCTSVKIGKANWEGEKIAENVQAVTEALVERFVTQKWKNVRGVHIKGPNTAALPIWLADELWTDDGDVLEAPPAEDVSEEVKAIEAPPANSVGSKRRASETEHRHADKATKKSKKNKASPDESLKQEMAVRKERLKKQKAMATAE